MTNVYVVCEGYRQDDPTAIVGVFARVEDARACVDDFISRSPEEGYAQSYRNAHFWESRYKFIAIETHELRESFAAQPPEALRGHPFK